MITRALPRAAGKERRMISRRRASSPPARPGCCSAAATGSTAPQPSRAFCARPKELTMRSQRLIGGRDALAREYQRSRSVADLPLERHCHARHDRLCAAPVREFRQLAARRRRARRPAAVDPDPDASLAAAPHADHAPRLRRGMERDRQMARRAALAHSRRRRAQHARQIYRLPLRRPLRRQALLREHRSGRRLPSADHPRLGHERAFAAGPATARRCACASSASSATSTPSTFSGSRRSRTLPESTAARAAIGKITPTISGMRGLIASRR